MIKLPYERKRRLAGWLFVLPWVIGALIFFIQPLIQSVYFAFCERMVDDNGNIFMEPLAGNPFQNFIDAFTKDAEFLPLFTESVSDIMYSLPVILVFSMFIGLLLSKEFRGRTFMRAVFFLPVIIASGIVINIMQSGMADLTNNDGVANINVFSNEALISMLLDSGLPRKMVEYLAGIVGRVTDLVWDSGVQILIFLTGALSIPPTFYEVSRVEGATAWESFWKITFPMLVPYMMITLVYTTVDILSSYNNRMLKYIVDTTYTKVMFGYGSALSWVYFLSVFLFVGLLFLIVSRFAHSETK